MQIDKLSSRFYNPLKNQEEQLQRKPVRLRNLIKIKKDQNPRKKINLLKKVREDKCIFPKDLYSAKSQMM